MNLKASLHTQCPCYPCYIPGLSWKVSRFQSSSDNTVYVFAALYGSKSVYLTGFVKFFKIYNFIHNHSKILLKLIFLEKRCTGSRCQPVFFSTLSVTCFTTLFVTCFRSQGCRLWFENGRLQLLAHNEVDILLKTVPTAQLVASINSRFTSAVGAGATAAVATTTSLPVG